ncbi:Uncharacterized protein TCM_043354 [Theobroma cacao]|uniref:Uncharacterized protein n=1 Tax=Theobroma cacao TaxID=3641 RepID=A0A061FPM7_THECC|nr:Uncharacterized protein TCM_043354 [Theobroma cacao]
MAYSSNLKWILVWGALFTVFATRTNGIDIFMDWNVSFSNSLSPLSIDQQACFYQSQLHFAKAFFLHFGLSPQDKIMNGIQQRLNSWQDGVSGTNCPIKPSTNWTYVFQIKDQIGSFSYFPSINFQKASGGYGPIRVNNRNVIAVPFLKPEAKFDLLIGDWYAGDYKYFRTLLGTEVSAYDVTPDAILMNGNGPYGHSMSTPYESFTVEKGMQRGKDRRNKVGLSALCVSSGKTYRFRISNVGKTLSFNFRIQNHTMLLVETEGSYTNQISLNSLDVHVGQSYSVLVTADQNDADFYMVASPKLLDTSIIGVYTLYQFPIQSVNSEAAYGISVVTGNHRGFGSGDWAPDSRNTYNVIDPIVRSTAQVYPGGWTAEYAFLDNPGMWNLRSQNLKNWYLGQELYIRVYDADPNPAKERPPPDNLLLCGIFYQSNAPAPAPGPLTGF